LEKLAKESEIICITLFKSKFKLPKWFEKSGSLTKDSKEENCRNLRHLETTLRRIFRKLKLKKLIFRKDKTKVSQLLQRGIDVYEMSFKRFSEKRNIFKRRKQKFKTY